jgi:hypothetical protein
MFLWLSASLMIALKTNFPEPALPAAYAFLAPQASHYNVDE